MNTQLKNIIVTLGLMLMVSSSYAESRWVSDELLLPLRSGKGNEFRILNKGLKSGTELVVIEEDQDSGWTMVETPRGTQGWVRSQYLKKQPTAAILINSTRSQLEKVKTENKKLKKQLSSTKSSGSELSKSLSQAEQQVIQLSKELNEIKSVSAGAIDLNKRHQTLTSDHQMLLTELDVLKATNEELQDNSNHTFFLYGIGAVLLGVLITIIAPHLRRRKRYSEWG